MLSGMARADVAEHSVAAGIAAHLGEDDDVLAGELLLELLDQALLLDELLEVRVLRERHEDGNRAGAVARLDLHSVRDLRLLRARQAPARARSSCREDIRLFSVLSVQQQSHTFRADLSWSDVSCRS